MKLLTGCAGFIGSYVARKLLSEGHEVIGVDNMNDAYDVRLKEWRLSSLKSRPGFKLHQFDITEFGALQNLFREYPFEAVINLAARAGVPQSLENPWVYGETNFMGTLNLLELCKDFGVRKLILASTSSIYGKGERPNREDQATDKPLSPYTASKKGAEVLCHSYHHLYELDVSVLRYFTVYGPAGRPDMSIFRFIRWISEGEPLELYGDGTQERDFSYVEDIAEGTVLALSEVGYEVINLGSDRPVSINQVISWIEELVGKKAVIEYLDKHPADVPATWADISKARELLGWEPKVKMEEGLRKSVEWYQENRQMAKELRLS